MKMIRLAAPWMAAVAAILYAVWLGLRVENLQSVTDLAYDAPTCCLPGSSGAKVRSCFQSRGYSVRQYTPGVDIVIPDLVLGDLSFRRFSALVYYGQDGTVVRWALDSTMLAF